MRMQLGYPQATYDFLAITDTLVLIADQDLVGRRSVTNDADVVVKDVDRRLGGLGRRRLFYRDSIGRYDELKHDGRGNFKGFAAGSPEQQKFFARLAAQHDVDVQNPSG